MLPAVTIRIFEPRKIFAERVDDRKLVYFDHNIWIELRDAKTAEAVACLNACKDAVTRERAIFPLSFPAVTEAIEIADRATREVHGNLLDFLSRGVTFRSPQILLTLEARQAYRWLFKDEEPSVPREEVFSSIPDHLGEGTLDFPPGWTAEKLADFMMRFTNEPRLRSVRYVAEQREWGKDHAPLRADYTRKMTEHRGILSAEAPRQKQAALSIAVMRERIGLIRSHVIPTCSAALISEVGPANVEAALRDMVNRKGLGGKRRIKDLFQKLPIMDQRARLFAFDAVEIARRPREQDFYDFDHGTAPPIYADAFVTMDGRLLRLIKEAGRARAEVLDNLNDVTRWLQVNCA